jgi:predicted AAA+ superfamily ATPase
MAPSIDLLKRLIADFHRSGPRDDVIDRRISAPTGSGRIVAVVGPRRAGKTYVMYAAMHGLLAHGCDIRQVLYVNFEDERLELKSEHLGPLLDAYRQLYPDLDLASCHFFLDEVQEVDGWEKFVRRLHDSVSRNVYVTGSSSRMLAREIATTLRGRTIPVHVYPLSFAEFLAFRGIDAGETSSSVARARFAGAFDEYLEIGGYPEAVRTDAQMARTMLQGYLDVMIYRDIIDRHGVRQAHVVKDMLKRIVENTARVFSVNRYHNELRSRGVAVSKDTLYAVFSHLEEAFIAFPCPKWDRSVAKRAQAMKKVYANDTGMVNATKFLKDADYGHLLETACYLHLLRAGMGVAYHSDSSECDFVVESPEGRRVIQACWELDAENRTRELTGLALAAKRFRLATGTIVTHAQLDEIDHEGVRVSILPAWRWLLSA